MFNVLFAFFLIASAFVANKIIVQELAPELFVFLRMTISGLLLMFFYCRKFNVFSFISKNIIRLIIIACFTTFIPSLLRAYALLSISSSRAAFWGAFEPFVTAFYLYILFGKKLNKTQFVGCLIGVIGAIVFVFMNAREEKVLSGESLILIADLAQIFSVVVSRYGWISAQTMLKKDIVSAQQLNGITFTISGIMALCLSLYKGVFFFPYAAMNVKIIGLLTYTIIIGNMLAYTLYAQLLKKYNATFVALSGLSMPMFVHLIAFMFLNEKFSMGFLVALGFVGIGIYLFYLYKEE